MKKGYKGLLNVQFAEKQRISSLKEVIGAFSER